MSVRLHWIKYKITPVRASRVRPSVRQSICGPQFSTNLYRSWNTVSLNLKKRFLDPEDGSQNATLVIVVVVVSSLKIPKAFLVRSRTQRNFAFTFVLLFPIDLPFQIFKLISN